jgi:pyruvate dehydrogenase kinase 2/3/4
MSVDKHPPTREGQEEWEEHFAKILENIYERHSSVLVQMARGAFELRAAIRKGALLGGDDDGCEGEGQKASDSDLRIGRDAVEFELMESTHAFLHLTYWNTSVDWSVFVFEAASGGELCGDYLQ